MPHSTHEDGGIAVGCHDRFSSAHTLEVFCQVAGGNGHTLTVGRIDIDLHVVAVEQHVAAIETHETGGC